VTRASGALLGHTICTDRKPEFCKVVKSAAERRWMVKIAVALYGGLASLPAKESEFKLTHCYNQQIDRRPGSDAKPR